MSITDKIPKELLLDIIEMFEDDKATLVNLSRTSRTFATLTSKSLYRNVSVGQCSTKQGDIPLLVRTLLERPDIASCIQKLSVVSAVFVETFDRWELQEQLNSMTRTQQAQLMAACTQWIGDHGDKTDPMFMEANALWAAAICLRQPCGFAGLLIALASHVQDLEVKVFRSADCEVAPESTLQCWFGLRQSRDAEHADPAPIIPMLPSLRTVTRLSTYGGNMELLGMGFNNLKTLEIDLASKAPEHLANYYNNELAPFETPMSLSQLKCLIIHSHWDELNVHKNRIDHVTYILETLGARNVTSFEFILGSSAVLTTAPITKSFDKLVKQLHPLNACLEELTIRFSTGFIEQSHRILKRFNPIISLQTFRCLRKVTSPFNAFIRRDYGVRFLSPEIPSPDDFLPPTVKHLTLLYPNAKTMRLLRGLFTTSRPKPLQLETITLACDDGLGRPAWWFQARCYSLRLLPVAVNILLDTDTVEAESTYRLQCQLFEEGWANCLFGNE